MYVKILFQRLLMELEEFAFQGCPDVRGPKDKQTPQRTLNNTEQQNVSLYITIKFHFIRCICKHYLPEHLASLPEKFQLLLFGTGSVDRPDYHRLYIHCNKVISVRCWYNNYLLALR